MYTKLASAIVYSTIWQESHGTRLVWITLLAMKNRHGEVTATVPGLAHAARVTREECDAAIQLLMSPDKDSSDYESATQGRRIERTADGWFVINHEKYQRLANEDDKRAKDAERQARKRRTKRDNPKSHEESLHTDTDASSSADPDSKPKSKSAPTRGPNGELPPSSRELGAFGAPVLKYDWDPDWLPGKEHTDLCKELGLTLAEGQARLDDCRLKAYPHGHRGEALHFKRELRWAKAEKDKQKFAADQAALRKTDETPGSRRGKDRS